MATLSIGIDFGTTKSHLAYIPRNAPENALPRIVTYDNSLHLVPTEMDIPDFRVREGNVHPVPTVVSVNRGFSPSSENPLAAIRCGYRALNPNEDRFSDYIIITRLKQDLGKKEIKKENIQLEPEGLAARFLYDLKKGAVEFRDYDEDTHGVTITVPAKSSIPQRMATRFAAVVAGFRGEIYTLEEPISAFLYHRHIAPTRFRTRGEAKHALVFDFGGGTCDVAVIEYREGQLPIVTGRATGWFGGEDIDRMLLENFWSCGGDYASQTDTDCLPYTLQEMEQDPNINLSLLLRYARRTKELLSFKEEEQTEIYGYCTREVGRRRLPPVRREHLRRMLEEKVINKVVAGQVRTASIRNHITILLQEALRESRIKPERIKKLIFAGGSSQLVGVRDWVVEFFHNSPLNQEDIIFSDLETSVAGGAAVHQFYRHSQNSPLRQVVKPTLSSKIRLVYYRSPDNTIYKEIVLGDAGQPLEINRLGYWSAPVFLPTRTEGEPICIEIIQGEEGSPECTVLKTIEWPIDVHAVLVKYLINEYGVVDRLTLVGNKFYIYWLWNSKQVFGHLLPDFDIDFSIYDLDPQHIQSVRRRYIGV